MGSSRLALFLCAGGMLLVVLLLQCVLRAGQKQRELCGA